MFEKMGVLTEAGLRMLASIVEEMDGSPDKEAAQERL
jgi:hypothetical protein